ncbi:MAG: hypothetical protein Fur0010_02770 [Bdellovibrio sp.]
MNRLIWLLIVMIFPLNLLAEETVSSADKVNREMLKKAVASYRLMIHKRTLSVRKMNPLDLAAMMKKEEDRKLFLELVEQSNMRSFAPAVLKGDTYYIELPFGHKAHFSITDVAQGIITINDRQFHVPKVNSYAELVKEMRKFLGDNRKTSFLDFFISPAYALFNADIKDIIIAHTSGYISINYDDSDFIHDDSHYAKIFHDSLSSEIDKAKSECEKSESDSKSDSLNHLSQSVKDIIDSLKNDDDSYNDYLIVSGLMKKYAGKVTNESNPTVKKSFSLTGEVMKAASVDGRYAAHFGDRCEMMIKTMLPSAYMPSTRRTFEQYEQNICQKMRNLKGCYERLDQEYARTADGRRSGLKPVEMGSLRAQQGIGDSSGK